MKRTILFVLFFSVFGRFWSHETHQPRGGNRDSKEKIIGELFLKENEKIVLTNEGNCQPFTWSSSLHSLFPADSSSFSDDPVLIFQCFEHRKSIGMFLANYFIQSSCARRTGAHFLSPIVMDIDQDTVLESEKEETHKQQQPHHHSSGQKLYSEENNSENPYTVASHQLQKSFLQLLPQFFFHPSPKSAAESRQLQKTHCNCHSLAQCLLNENSSFYQERTWIAETMQELIFSLEHFLQQKQLNETIINPIFDEINLPLGLIHSSHLKPEEHHHNHNHHHHSSEGGSGSSVNEKKKRISFSGEQENDSNNNKNK
jgi:hypothetical protein